MNNKRLLLMPQYMHEFKCIASKCEDTCCVGWNILLDKSTYKEYKKCKNGMIKDKLNQKAKRNRLNPTDQSYGKIDLDENGRCPFLSDDMLCSVQSILGEKYLSTTCSSYPRVTNIVDGHKERSATLSCPEAARLVLLNINGIEFDEILEEEGRDDHIVRIINTGQDNTEKKAKNFFWELRKFTIALLQNRSYRIWERLVILGLFYQKLDIYIKQNKVNHIPELIKYYSDQIDKGIYSDYLKEIPTNVDIQLKILKELVDARVIKGVRSQRYIDCIKDFLYGIGYSQVDDESQFYENYTSCYNKYYRPPMDDYEYIFENYLVNYVFQNLFPFTKVLDIWESYAMLVIQYALLKMQLIGMTGVYKENFSTEHIVKLIQSFTKTIDHSNEFINYIHNFLKENGVTSMGYMSILIKN